MDQTEVKAAAENRAQLQEKALAAVASPSDPSTEKAVAVQALAPTPPKKRCWLLDCLRGKRTEITNKEATGPTTVTLP